MFRFIQFRTQFCCHIFIALTFLSFASYSDTQKPIINVGIYAPFSGEFAIVGDSMLNAMMIAKDNLINNKYNYAFYKLDQSADQSKEKKRLTSFIKDKHINILISEGSIAGLLSKKIAATNHLIHFSLASDPRIADGIYNFLAWSPAEEQATVLANELRKKNITSIGIIRVDHPWAKVIGDQLIIVMKNLPIKVVMDVKFKAGTTDFSPIIMQMKTTHPKMFFIMGFQQDMLLWRRQMLDANLHQPITSVIERISPQVKEVFEGQFYVDTPDMSAIFLKQYQKTYHQIPVTEGGYAYDAFTMIANSIDSSNSGKEIPNSSAISKKLHRIMNGHGVMGMFYIKPNGIVFTNAVVKTIKNGNPVIVK